MKREHEIELIETLRTATESPQGIRLRFLDSEDMKKYRQKLYSIRRQHPEYQGLTFSDKGTELWIIPRTPDD